MNRQNVFVILFVVFLLALIPLVSLAAPPVPYTTYGTVKVNGQDVAAGTVITGSCAGVQYASTLTTFFNGESFYVMDVPGDDPDIPGKDGCYAAETVTFKVGNYPAAQTGVWTSGSARLNLTATRPIPGIAARKWVNGLDANTAPGAYLLAGSPLTWTYVVTNTGQTALAPVVIKDDHGTPANSSDDVTVCTIASLAVSAAQTCSLNGTAVSGPYVNIGTATGTPPNDPPVSASDPSHYFGANPILSVVKTTNGQDANTPPGPYLPTAAPITWGYTVNNPGNVDLSNVTLTDDNGTPANPGDDIIVGSLPSLAMGASANFTYNGSALAGQYANIVTARGTPPGGLAVVSATDASHYFGMQPGLSLVKKTQGVDVSNPPGPYIPVGDPVNWSYLVTNTGNVALANILVTDDNGTSGNAGDDVTVCTISSLASGANQTCYLSRLAIADQYQNTATVTGQPPVGAALTVSDTSYYYGANLTTILVKQTNSQDANSPSGPLILVGDPVTWTYDVTNNGNVTLTNVLVNDDNGTPGNPTDDRLICTIPSLAAGATTSCNLSSTAIEGQYGNLGTVVATPPGGLSNISTTDPSHYFGARPAISIVKKTNGQDSNLPPGPYILAGSAVTWSYIVTNSGNINLTNVVVRDDNGTIGNPTDDFTVCTLPTLAASEVQTCTTTGSATTGPYTNLATVSAVSPIGPSRTASDPDNYFGANPTVSLVKKTNGQRAVSPPGPVVLIDQTVTWTYDVSNTGNVPLTNVVVIDDNGTPSNPADDFQACSIASLAAGTTQTCTKTGTVSAGQYTNHASLTAVPPVGPALNANDTSNYYGARATLQLTKTTNGVDVSAAPGPHIPVGNAVNWAYTVANTGEVTLVNLTVIDDKGTSGNPADDITVCTIPSLAASTNQTCTYSGTATAGQYTNQASVTGTYASTPISASDASYYFGTILGIDLVKKTNGQDANAAPGVMILVGGALTWDYVVTNNSNVLLTNIRVRDNNGTPGNPSDDFNACVLTSLAAGANQTCTRTGTATAGQYANLGTATATPPGGLGDISDTDLSHYFGVNPIITLIKRTNGQDANTPPGPHIPVGSNVTWSYQVNNPGNVTLTNVQVKDNAGTPSNPSDDWDICTIASLAAGGTQTCTKQLSAVAGQYANIATVSASAPIGPSVSANDASHYFGASLSLSLMKKVNGQDANTAPGVYILVGGAVNWSYDITNGSNVALTGVQVVDDNGTPTNTGDDVTICTIATLAAGAVQTCTASSTAVVGQYTNRATVTGTPPGGLTALSANDSANYFGTIASITLVKKTNGQDANTAPGPTLLEGDPVDWSYEVANAGNVVLGNVVVDDDQGVAVSCQQSTLNINENMTCTASGTATAGQYVNLGNVSAQPPGGLAPIVVTDLSHYMGIALRPSIDVQKTTNGQNAATPPGVLVLAGDPIIWDYLITNNGNTVLNSITLTDDNGTPGNPSDDFTVCSLASLPHGAVHTCQRAGTALTGQYANTVLGTATTPGGLPVSDSDISHYFGVQLGLGLMKQTNGVDANAPPGPSIEDGQVVTWTYQVTNLSNVSLADLEILDDNGTPGLPSDDFTVCTIPSLAAGAVQTCSASATAVQGQYANFGRVQALYASHLVGASDASHYMGIPPGLRMYLPVLRH